MARRTKRTILVTAGPTRAYLDDIRFLSNLSTGALGYEICREFIRRQWNVIAIVGPSSLPFEELGLTQLIRVDTNQEMLNAALQVGRKCLPSFAIFSAAVLDFVPSHRRIGKTRSALSSWRIQLVPAPKIILEFARRFPKTQRVEFKLETKSTNPITLGRKILQRTGSLAVCVNFLRDVSKRGHRATLVTPAHATRLTTKRSIAQSLGRLLAESTKMTGS
ncbi:MAG: hypothetical protein HYZ71_00325 [Deltaproteobacteria bacterium]|nr:hypothetical protein [Deltaproteobacteria bacterium]